VASKRRKLRSTTRGISTATKLALNLVPVVGPVVAQSLALYETERRNSYVDAFLAALAAQLEGIREAKLDKEFVIGLEFQAATLRALEAARVTSSAGKRRLIAAALAGASSSDRPSGLDIEAIIDTLGNLTPTDLELARLVWLEAGGDTPRAIVTSIVGPADFPDRLFHLKRLEAAGLIADTAGKNLDYGGQYDLTPTFHRLMALLKGGGLSQEDSTAAS
jgi:hypothetical protein